MTKLLRDEGKLSWCSSEVDVIPLVADEQATAEEIREIELRANGPANPATENFVCVRHDARGGVLDVAFLLVRQCRDSNVRHPGHERTADSALEATGIELAERYIDVTRERVGRVPRGEVHESGGAVRSEKHPLRTAQHLHPLEIEKPAREIVSSRIRHVVDDDSHRQLEASVDRGIRAEAPDPRLNDRSGHVHAKVRHVAGYVLKVGDAMLTKESRVEHRHGDRHVVELLFTALRRDDDLLDRVRALLRERFRDSERRHGQREREREDASFPISTPRLHAPCAQEPQKLQTTGDAGSGRYAQNAPVWIVRAR